MDIEELKTNLKGYCKSFDFFTEKLNILRDDVSYIFDIDVLDGYKKVAVSYDDGDAHQRTVTLTLEEWIKIGQS